MDYKSKISRIENSVFLLGMILMISFPVLGFTEGLWLLILSLIGVKIYIYSIYKDNNETDQFWINSSKPALAGLLTVALVIVLDYYDLFQLIN